MRAVEQVFRQVRSLGPYLAIELILPGGSIVALLLWTFRNRPAARQIAATDRDCSLRAVDSLHRGVARRKLRQHASRSSLGTDLQLVARSLK